MYTHYKQQEDIALMPWTYIQKVPSSNLGWGIAITTEVFMVFLNPSKHMPGKYLDYAMTASFQMLTNSSLTNHPTIQHYIIWYTGSIKMHAYQPFLLDWNAEECQRDIQHSVCLTTTDTHLFLNSTAPPRTPFFSLQQWRICNASRKMLLALWNLQQAILFL
jgi:hypothetical protein